jgi:hypothetical protein
MGERKGMTCGSCCMLIFFPLALAMFAHHIASTVRFGPAMKILTSGIVASEDAGKFESQYDDVKVLEHHKKGDE